ncbi:hypothetical protein NDU88_001829, partial [Pleurodeles waltl]
PTLFKVYAQHLVDIIMGHGFSTVSYTDDSQIIISLTSDTGLLFTKCNAFLRDITDYMSNSNSILNGDRTGSGTLKPNYLDELPPPKTEIKTL